MKKAHLNLINYAIANGHTISVWDMGEWQVKKSTSYQDIKDAIDSVEMSELSILNNKGKQVGWALIIDQGEPDETVSDYTITPFMDAWEEHYNATV